MTGYFTRKGVLTIDLELAFYYSSFVVVTKWSSFLEFPVFIEAGVNARTLVSFDTNNSSWFSGHRPICLYNYMLQD